MTDLQKQLKAFGVKQLREQLGWSQAELAKHLDKRCTLATISRWENGHTPGKFYLRRLEKLVRDSQLLR